MRELTVLITKFHDMSTVTFPWQHNELHALSIRWVKSEFPSLKKCYLLIFVHSVGVSKYEHYSAQALES